MNVVSSQLEDPVDRLRWFRELHPDIKITPPGPATMLWRAEKDAETLAESFWLERLMNQLEEVR